MDKGGVGSKIRSQIAYFNSRPPITHINEAVMATGGWEVVVWAEDQGLRAGRPKRLGRSLSNTGVPKFKSHAGQAMPEAATLCCLIQKRSGLSGSQPTAVRLCVVLQPLRAQASATTELTNSPNPDFGVRINWGKWGKWRGNGEMAVIAHGMRVVEGCGGMWSRKMGEKWNEIPTFFTVPLSPYFRRWNISPPVPLAISTSPQSPTENWESLHSPTLSATAAHAHALHQITLCDPL